jgi:hypothetical protein
MRQLIVFLFLVCASGVAVGQLKDMPTQAEFDPILENADAKMRDFLSTLRKYRAEASEVDGERLQRDLRDFEQVRQVIAIAHSGAGNHGFTVGRLFTIVTSLDDAAMEASVWSNLLTAKVCGPHSSSTLQFALAIQTNGGMLREVANQLSHPVSRLASAADDIIKIVVESPSKTGKR